MYSRSRIEVLVGAALIGLAVLAIPAASAVAATPPVTVAATQPPAGLVPPQTATSTITLHNATNLTITGKVTVTLPATSATSPTFTLTPASGVTCAVKTGAPRIHVCTAPGVGASVIATIGTITGTPPSNIGSGLSASVQVKGPSNTVTVTWQWGLPKLVTTVSLSPSTIYLGQWVTGTLTVTNAGNGTAGGFITDTPMPALGAAPMLISQTTGTSCIPYNNDLWCPMSGLAPGASATVVWSMEPYSGPSTKVTSTADSANQVVQSSRAGDVATSNVVSVVGTGAKLAVSAQNPSPLPQGSNFDRTVTVTNTGDTPAYNANVQDWTYSTFPLIGTVSGGTCAVFMTSTGGGRGSHQVPGGTACDLGTIASGASANVTYELEAAPTLAPNTYTSSLRVGTSTPQSTDTGGTASITIVVPTSPVAPALLSAPGVPTGNTVVGDVLTAGTGSWNGTPPLSYSYHWSDCDLAGRACSPIRGASGATYTLQPSDVGSTMEARVTASNGGGSASAKTPPTSAVIPAVAPTNTSAPYVSPQGEPVVGTTYVTSTGTWNGTPTITYAFQWYDCNATGTKCTPISGATGSSYVLASSDLGHYLEAVVSATNSGGSKQAASNLATTES